MSGLPADEWADLPDPDEEAERLAASVKPRPPAPPDPEPEPPQLVYDTVWAFVAEHLSPLYQRPMGYEFTWCAEPWRHPEAWTRLEALWRAWEHLRLEAALGMSVWLRDHLDHHMPVLMHANGPFHGCSPDKHLPGTLQPLPVAELPAGLAPHPTPK